MIYNNVSLRNDSRNIQKTPIIHNQFKQSNELLLLQSYGKI